MLRTVIEALGSFLLILGQRNLLKRLQITIGVSDFKVEIFVKSIAVARQTVFYSCHTTVQNK